MASGIRQVRLLKVAQFSQRLSQNSWSDRKCCTGTESHRSHVLCFRMLPTQEMVLKKDTLSPTELRSTIDVSIWMAYSYLAPELKQLGIKLSHIPGSFDEINSFFLFRFNPGMLPDLVQRSLLQTSHNWQTLLCFPMVAISVSCGWFARETWWLEKIILQQIIHWSRLYRLTMRSGLVSSPGR